VGSSWLYDDEPAGSGATELQLGAHELASGD
jgi:hypothetical protein